MGSKRLPNKNIKNFNGYPLLYWSIAAAKKVKIIDKIYVSTDSLKIKKIAVKSIPNISLIGNIIPNTSSAKNKWKLNLQHLKNYMNLRKID